MNIEPLFDRVVLKPKKIEEKKLGGFVLPESSQEKPTLAEVVAVGKGEWVDGKCVPMQVAVGDSVIYSKFAGSEYKLDGEDLIIIRQTDILAKLN